MKQEIDYKVSNGKMIGLEVDLDSNIIKSIKITGDFFVHPKRKIEEIEKELKNTEVENVASIVKNKIESEGIQLIGFGPQDLEEAIKKLVQNKQHTE